ncbi:MAG: S8 family serine peptidase [Phycisphaerae bacterium]
MRRPVTRFARASFVIISPVFLLVASLPASAAANPKITPELERRIQQSEKPVAAWVFLTDKGVTDAAARDVALQELARNYNPRAIQRRLLRRTDSGLFDERDLPIAGSYIDAVSATGAHLRVTSTWLNAISVMATADQAQAIAALPFVARLEPVLGGKRVEPSLLDDPVNAGDFDLRGPGYGVSFAQLDQINVVALHTLGYTGQGVIVGILDTGFNRTHQAFNEPGHPVQIVAEHDFINNDNDTTQTAADPSGQSQHGTYVLGVLGGYKPGSFLGGAYNASFIICKTEDISSETPIEEDNYVAGLQFIEAHGGDMATASLGYIDWYTQAQLNGLTAVTTVAVNVASSNGLICLNAAGNNGHDSNPTTSNLIAPADAFKVITCGAVDSSGVIAGFSSDGPTADGRVKPEVLAQGVSVRSVSFTNNTNYSSVSGTSFSTPLTACAVACLIQARPTWTVDQMRTALFTTAGDFVANGTTDPLFIRGYGIIDAAAALNAICSGDLNGDRTVNEADLGILLGAWQTSNAGDLNGDGLTNEADLGVLLGNWHNSCTP